MGVLLLVADAVIIHEQLTSVRFHILELATFVHSKVEPDSNTQQREAEWNQ